MSQKLWEAKLSVKKKSNLFKFENFLNKKFRYKGSKNYKKLLNWSIKNLDLFWISIWDYTNVKGKKIDKFKFGLTHSTGLRNPTLYEFYGRLE